MRRLDAIDIDSLLDLLVQNDYFLDRRLRRRCLSVDIETVVALLADVAVAFEHLRRQILSQVLPAFDDHIPLVLCLDRLYLRDVLAVIRVEDMVVLAAQLLVLHVPHVHHDDVVLDGLQSGWDLAALLGAWIAMLAPFALIVVEPFDIVGVR